MMIDLMELLLPPAKTSKSPTQMVKTRIFTNGANVNVGSVPPFAVGSFSLSNLLYLAVLVYTFDCRKG